MNLKGLIITDHARERFKDRCAIVHPGMADGFEGLMQKLLQQAKLERVPLRRLAYRTMMHGNVPTVFYKTKCGWRFVLVEHEDGKRTLVTCERVNKFQNAVIKIARMLGAWLVVMALCLAASFDGWK